MRLELMSTKEMGREVSGAKSGQNIGGRLKKVDKCFGVRQNYFKNLILLFTIYMI